MQIELSVVTCGGDGSERTYNYSVSLPDSTPLEQIEAHSKNMLRILDHQANESASSDEDDEDDGDAWKQSKPPEKKAP